MKKEITNIKTISELNVRESRMNTLEAVIEMFETIEKGAEELSLKDTQVLLISQLADIISELFNSELDGLKAFIDEQLGINTSGYAKEVFEDKIVLEDVKKEEGENKNE